jgi:tRNA pseudouridine38-40 synthase
MEQDGNEEPESPSGHKTATPKRRRYRLDIAYDGSPFEGWQKQKDRARPSIQETLENAIGEILQAPIQCVASGRTDAGVHAICQTVHFDLPESAKIPKTFVRALNAITPTEISILKGQEISPEFHALFKATHKTYIYVIDQSPVPSPLFRRYSLWVRNPLNLDVLNSISSAFLGTHDFKSLQTTGTDVKSTVRTIMEAKWDVWPTPLTAGSHHNFVYFSVTGTGFLKHMVRTMVGTVLELADNDQTVVDLEKIIGAKDRQKAKKSADPQGLYLQKVYYPEEFS